ncbi:hypothetical protein VOLCADRAFT_106073 [Volvox carteri f. nagariensis]|uniref:N-acetyltransferase domain-containing protein n=1 Tax=Volvox carteri f. nagariensis TaxID=3068 RepID=D8U4X0_VOLCA|nr:uncharacterized protein VOLCADRAFT_106073 [Volvox carteri f. nagariensis]EFJ45347.1 hypothetical protein VOLCADRAFT_106073 [Volvox carteri f. nagariensis]|eukprot:XP_002953723.1 hypothetical protein VOLCADRAFT_106073 [Volvox carteri f. nagariensis]
MSVAVRLLRREDIPASLRLHKFAKHDSQNVFSARFLANIAELHEYAADGRSGVRGLVACAPFDNDDEVVGALIAQWEEDYKCVLLTLVVRGDYRGRGVAKSLLDELLRASRVTGSAEVSETEVESVLEEATVRQSTRSSWYPYCIIQVTNNKWTYGGYRRFAYGYVAMHQEARRQAEGAHPSQQQRVVWLWYTGIAFLFTRTTSRTPITACKPAPARIHRTPGSSRSAS